MPTVSQYGGPKVQTGVVQGPRDQVGANKWQAIAPGIQALGKGVTEWAEDMAKTDAQNALLKYQEESRNLLLSPDGFFNKQGKSAIDAAETTSKQLEDLKEKYGKELGSTARGYFDPVATNHVTRHKDEIAVYTTKQAEVYKMSTLGAEMDNSVNLAGLHYAAPERLSEAKVLGEAALADALDRQAASPEVRREKTKEFRSKFYSSAIMSALSDDDFDNARKILNNNSADISVEQQSLLEQKIKSRERMFTAVKAATDTVDLYGDDLVTGMDKISEQFKNDPELRTAAQQEYMRQSSLWRTANAEDRINAYDGALKALTAGTSITDIMDSPAWSKLSAEQQMSIRQGTPIKTDLRVLNNLMSMTDEELIQADLTSFFGSLSATDAKMVMAERRKAMDGVSRTATQTEAQANKSILVGVLGPEAKWNDKDRAFAADFHIQYDAAVKAYEAEHKIKPNPDKAAEIRRKIVADTKVKSSFLGIPYTSSKSPEKIDRAYAPRLREWGVPNDQMNGYLILANEIAKSGREVTKESLIAEARRQSESK